MNLTKLFEVQAVLKARIGYKREDKIQKMMLAMLVEFMECANEWQGFKYWKKNSMPKTSATSVCGCVMCEHHSVPNDKNPLLEEYVDGLHFVLETGLELIENNLIEQLPINAQAANKIIFLDTTDQFKQITWVVLKIDAELSRNDLYQTGRFYLQLIEEYLLLGKLLGFTEEQIEAAYLEKNKVNHKRQDENY
ncbi:dUTP diphosphatase [Bacillus luti]|uniref:dUTP diphosphatase n=1 Tax=Bacillus luti TaxID=2026191 RepID=UPI0028997FD6|nr:dUTP diphosphatase [Bacillus luti]